MNKFLNSQNYILYIFIAFLFNLIYFHFGLNTYGLSWDKIYKITGDSIDYVNSAENWINGQGFTFHKTNEDKDFVSNFQNPNQYNISLYYAFRSPGFAMIYVPLRLFLSQHFSLIAFLFLQVILTAIAKFQIAKIIEILFNSKKLFYLSFILINITPYYSYYNNLLLTDALGGAFLIFAIYYFVKYFSVNHTNLDNRLKLNLFVSGLFITIAIMLRPFLAVFLVGFFLFIVWMYRNNFKRLFIIFFIFISSFGIIDGIWIIRNYVQTHKFIPLASTMEFHDHKHLAFHEFKKIATNLNYSNYWWDGTSPVYWLNHPEDSRHPNEVFVNHKNQEFVSKLSEYKILFHQSLNSTFTLQQRKDLELLLQNNLIEMNQQITSSLGYGLMINKLKGIPGFLIQPNIKFFHSFYYPINVVIVFIQSFVFKLIALTGFIACLLILLIRKFKNYGLILSIILPALFLVIYFGFIHQSLEYRELYTYYPLLLIALLGFAQFLKRFYKFYWIVLSFTLVVLLYFSYHQTIAEIKW